VSKPNLKKVLDALKNQVLVGKSYLRVAKGLLQADPVILQTAPTFFGLTTDGSLELAQMAVARLYDATAGAVTVQKMLGQAALNIASFRASENDVKEGITEARKLVAGLDKVLGAIRTRRNEWLAHLDPRTVADPRALAAKAKLTIPDIEKAFKDTETLLIKVSCLYDGTFGDLRFIGGDDYEQALDWIRIAKCEHIERYEREFGTWTGPRPRDCSREKF
jgi:AbiU2